jgi:hypothetical protein
MLRELVIFSMYIAYISDEIWIFYAFEIVSKKASVYFQP